MVFKIKCVPYPEPFGPKKDFRLVYIWNGKEKLGAGLAMTKAEWEAFQSLLVPSPKADFELIEEEPCQTKQSKS